MGTSVMLRLGDIAAQYNGMLTTSQALEVGVRRDVLGRLTRQGLLERVMQGVYRFTSAVDQYDRIYPYATWLALGGYKYGPGEVPPVVAVRETAAAAHGIGVFANRDYEFAVPARRGTRLRARLHTRVLQSDDVCFVEGLPVTTVERTIADLVIAGTADLSNIARAAADAESLRLLKRPDQDGIHAGDLVEKHPTFTTASELMDHLRKLGQV